MKYVFVLILSLTAYKSQACKCADQQDLSLDLCHDFDFISRVKIDSVSSCDGQSTAYGSIIELFKGVSREKVILKFDCSSSCQMNIEKGDTWLFYAKTVDGNFKLSLCDRNRKYFENEAEDFYKDINKMSFEEEVAFLKSNIGLKQIAGESNERMVDITQRQNELGDAQSKIWLVVASFSILLLFYFLFNKYFK